MFLALSFQNLAALTLLAGLVGCASSPQTAVSPSPTTASKASSSSQGSLPTVVVTHTVLCDLAKQIAADTANIKCLISSGSDPHIYEPTPNDRKAIETSNLTLYGGYDFEPQLIKLIEATSNPAPKVAVDEAAVPNPQKFEEDGQTVTDPHVWHNLQNGVQMAAVVNQSLAKLEPNNVQLYADNTKRVTTELTQLDSWIKSQVATIPAAQRKLVTTHDALGYYSKAYGIPIEGALGGISTEEAPTAARVKELVGEIKTTQVPTIFAEITINPKIIAAVAKEANVKVSDQELYTDGLGAVGSTGETYQKLMMANTQAIVEGLGGKFTPFQPKTSLLNSTSPQALINVRRGSYPSHC
jgi:manganese/iron transport system substrate-binding protein